MAVKDGESFRVRFVKFCRTADIHGVRFVAGEGGTTRKAAWCIFLLGFLVFLGVFVGFRVHEYLLFDVRTRTDVSSTLERQPTMKLCTWDPYVPSRLSAADILTVSDSAERPRYTDLFKVILPHSAVTEDTAGRRFISPQTVAALRSITRGEPQHTLNVSQVFNFRADAAALAAILVSHGSDTPLPASRHASTTDMFMYAMRTTEEFLSHCEIEGTDIQGPACVALWRRTPSSCGVCYELDTDVIPKGLHLYVWINFSPDVYISHIVKFYEVYVEERDETVQSLPMRLTLPIVNNETMLSFRLRQVNKASRQQPPYGPPCAKDGHLKYSELPYSRPTCQDECISDYMREHQLFPDGCLPYFVPGPPTALRCTNYSMVPTAFTYYNLSLTAATLCSAQCPLPCEEWCYEPTIVQHSPLHEFFKKAHVVYRTDGMTNQMSITEVPSYPLDAMLAELGGIMGLFLGISALTVIHVIEFCLAETLTAMGF